MTILIKGSKVFYHNAFEESDVLIADDGQFILVSKADFEADQVLDGQGTILLPSFINPYLYKDNGNSSQSGYNYSLAKFQGQDTELINKDFIYLLEDVTDQFVKENDDFIYYANINDLRIKNLNCRIHLSKIKTSDLTKLKELKKNHDITCDVEIKDLLADDNASLIEAINENLIEMISVDEAIDLNYVFGLCYSKLVKSKKLSLEKLIELLSYNVALNLEIKGGELINFESASLAIFDLHYSERINEGSFKGQYLASRCLLNVADGVIKYQDI